MAKPLVARAAGFLRRLPASLAARRWLAGFAHRGKGVRCYGRPRVAIRGAARIGAGSGLVCVPMPVDIACHEGAVLDVGERAVINYGVLIAAKSRVSIGARVSIGNLCIVSDCRFPTRPGEPGPTGDAPEPIEIGDDVWLAARVTVLPGARIGASSVVGAGSIVSGVIPPGVIAVGIPARPVGVVRREK